MLPFKLVYCEEYDLQLGSHVFPSQKYRLIKEALIAENIASPEDFLKPQLAADADILRVHTTDYVHRIKSGTLSASEQMILEIPAGPETVRAFWLAAGGSILAGQHAMKNGFAANIGGGFHHAYPGHGEGFCMINDVAVAIRRLQVDGAVGKAMVVDTDVHHGNGTAAIFAKDETVFTLSIHQERNYPNPKPPSNIDLHLPDRIGDDEYLNILGEGMIRAFEEFQPDIIFYVGGADPYREDQLGGLSLTIDGLRERDRMVFQHARRRNVPVTITLAGGYARHVADTVKIHVNTIVAARDVLIAKSKK
jgi:acetoin utilization deacetylase AcuC-like enzyme